MESKLKYEKHLFICTNQRPENAPRPSCGEQHGLALVAAFKKAIKDKHLDMPIRAQRAGCLDLCEQGPTVVVYPEGVFYGNVQLEDVQEIVDQHIALGNPVERLRLKFDN
ncbi:MAG: (2Fe-2S) ferredoxin domain-containing protein [Bacteroidia bacterium]